MNKKGIFPKGFTHLRYQPCEPTRMPRIKTVLKDRNAFDLRQCAEQYIGPTAHQKTFTPDFCKYSFRFRFFFVE